MKGKLFYEEVKQFVKPIWVSIFTINIIVNIITQIASTLISSLYVGVEFQMLMDQIMYSSDFDIEMAGRIITSFAVMSIIAGIVGRFVMAALTLAILDCYRDQEKITIKKVWDIIQEHFSAIAVIGIVTSFIMVFLIVSPGLQIVSPFIIFFMDLFFAFSYFMIYDEKANDGLTALRLSAKETRGHKFNIFRITFHYSLIIFSGLLVTFIGFFMVAYGTFAQSYELSFLGFTLIFGGLGLYIYLTVRYTPYLIAAPVVYYAKINEDNAL